MEETVSSTTQLKSSAQRHIKKGVLQQYPELAKYADDILPPKVLREAKWYALLPSQVYHM